MRIGGNRSTAWGRQAWKRLRAAIAEAPGVTVLPHDYPDPDALASGWAVLELCRLLKRPARLVYGGELDRPENRALVSLLRVPARRVGERWKPPRRTAIVMVDSSPGAGNNLLRSAESVVAVLDNHHGASTAGLGSRLRRACGATSTMAFELLQAAGIAPGTRLATALFCGIRTDTEGLGREASAADEAAYRRLLPMVDHRLLARIEHPRMPQSSFRLLASALTGTRLSGGAAVTAMGRLEMRGGPSVAVDLLVRLQGIRCAMAHGRWGSQEVFSVRSTDRRLPAWRLARAVAGPDGLAGGHDLMAGGFLPRPGPACGGALQRRFLRAARGGKKRARRLVYV